MFDDIFGKTDYLKEREREREKEKKK